jgi:tripartite-type tricarboxylate transporter receptor subunit TctC
LICELPAGRAEVLISSAALMLSAGRHSEIALSVMRMPSAPAFRAFVPACKTCVMALRKKSATGEWREAMSAKPMTSVALVTSALVIAALNSATAQVYPSHPITMVVPYPAGGPTDAVARILAEGMRASLGQPIIIENVSGAGGSLGVRRVARAAPDGYTLSIGQLNSHVFSGAIYGTQYNLVMDFEPVAPLTTNPLMFVGKKDLPAKNMNELLAWLNANPGKASFGTIGAGSPTHVWGIYFQNETGIRFQFVPYRGAVPVMQDMLAGQLDLTSLQASDMLPHVRSEKIRAYAILAKDPWWAAPDIPTVDAAGVPGLHMPFWHGLWVPKATPKDIIAKLNAAVVEALGDPSVRQRFSNLGQEIFPREQQTPEALRALQKAEIEKWWPIIKAANVNGE